ncbi:MAG: thermonuclease family protein [Chloroflexota bacterium]|nr:thermonuclease family protein [Chloroflexota bacterium]MDE2919956.1 thermonuclease family protein [Chloroflexota bacterium]
MDLDGAPGRLASVIDGDTFTIATRSGEVTVRILGIDAPEFDDVGQRELAEQAREALRTLIGGGPVRLVADAESKDAGGRLLRHAFRGNRLLAADLARQGWARSLPIAPNLAQQDAIHRAVVEARAADRGIWALNSASVTLSVDKVREVVTLTNTGPAPLQIGGWWLVSLRGKQGFRFPLGTTIGPGESLRVVAGQAAGVHRFQHRNVWNNSSPDPAELRRSDGRIAAVWDDSGSGESKR